MSASKTQPIQISIIIPTYNEEKYLPLCLEAIAGLSRDPETYEVIVVDNGSGDGTCRIARNFNATLLQDATKTVAGLRNLGAEKARGNVLAFVDADCVVSSDWLDAVLPYADDPTVSVWGGPPVPPPSASWVQQSWFLMVANKEAVEQTDWIGAVDLCVERGLFHQIGGFNESLTTCEDVDFCYRAAEYGKIISDRRIKIIHLREADTVKEFFKKEVWRGTSNLEGLSSHGLLLKELPSLIVPFYFAAFIPLISAVTVWTQSLFLLTVSLAGLCLPGMMFLRKVRGKNASLKNRFQITILGYVYFIARSCSLWQVISGIKKKA